MEIDFYDVRNDFDSYNKIINTYYEILNKDCSKVIFNCKNVCWIDATLVSIIEALLFNLKNNNIIVDFINLKDDVKLILQKNEFLLKYRYEKVSDFNNTTVKYSNFLLHENIKVLEYIQNEVFKPNIVSEINIKIKQQIKKSIFELYNNSSTHSESKFGVFCCGQYFPKKSKFEFMITDTGIGIKNRIRKDLNQNMNGKDAINKIINELKTTKKDITGGLGLQLLKDFIEKNKGKLTIISNEGFWELDGNKIESKLFEKEFIGTSICLSIKTDAVIEEDEYNEIHF